MSITKKTIEKIVEDEFSPVDESCFIITFSSDSSALIFECIESCILRIDNIDC